MEKLIINSKAFHEHRTNFPDAPAVYAEPSNGIIEISGNAFGYSYNAKEHFKPLIRWLEEYFSIPRRKIKFNFRINYINPQYAEYMLDIINQLSDYQGYKKELVEVNWYYEKDDLDMQEEGDEFQKKAKLDVNLIAYQKEE